MSLIDHIRAETAAASLSRTAPNVTGAWQIACLFCPHPGERKFHYNIVLVQTKGIGCAYSTAGDDYREELKLLMGTSGLQDNCSNVVEVALLDSLNTDLAPEPQALFELEGLSSEKASWRAGIVVSEACALVAGKEPSQRSAAVIGAVGELVRQLQQSFRQVFVTDQDDDLIGGELYGVEVLSGTRSEQIVEVVDVAVVTGMAIANGTIDGLIAAARRGRTALIVFAQTGAHLAGHLLSGGVDVVVAEYFPFYIFDGRSQIAVHRKE